MHEGMSSHCYEQVNNSQASSAGYETAELGMGRESHPSCSDKMTAPPRLSYLFYFIFITDSLYVAPSVLELAI